MLRPGQVIVVCVLALLCIGVVMVNSAGMTVRPDDAGPGTIDPDALFRSLITSKPVIYLGLSVLAMGATAMLPIARLADGLCAPDASRRRSTDAVILGVGTLVLVGIVALVYVPGLGREVNGSSRWITLPGVGIESIQPSEVAKWGIVLLTSWYGARRAHEMREVLGGLGPALAAAALIAGLVALEDLGTGVLIGVTACVVLIGAGARLWPFFASAPIGALAIGGLILANPYRLERITAFLDPYADPRGAGYHMIQAMAAIAGGEGPGRGLGHGLQKFGYLPEDRTDFVFAVISEELGIAGAGMVIALYVALVWACIAIVRREERRGLQLVGLGVATTVGIQAVMNLMVVTGMAPTKGIALPLVSAGGTGWLLTSAALGLLVAIDRSQAARERVDAEAVEWIEDEEDEAPELVVSGAGLGARAVR